MEFLTYEKIYQWDTNKVLEIMPCAKYTVAEVHFQHCGESDALVVEIYEEEGRKLAKIPNILLQSSAPIKAWLTDGEKTICGQILTVNQRAKPADYVYTETEVKRYETLEKRIENLEKNGSVPGGSVDLSEIESDIENLQESVSKLSEEISDLKENAPTDEHINELINVALGVVENGTY